MFKFAVVAMISGLLGAGAAAEPQLPPGHPSPGGLPAGHPQPSGMPQGHPNVMQHENADVPEPPDARPEDVATIDGIIGAYYASLSGPKGQAREWDRLRSIFQPMAGLVAARPLPGGRTGMWVMKLEEYIAFNKAVMEKGGYFEKEVYRETLEFGNMAHVWSTYEARRVAEDPKPYSRGIYSFQLLKDGPRWWIVNVFWDHERIEAPIPSEFLPGS
jgi:hypothetical protein